MENIAHIFYINLDRRQDRNEEIQQEFRTHFDMKTNQYKIERFRAIDRPQKGIVGCTNSHLEVLKTAKKRNYKNVLIFEDDFTFTVSKEEFEETLKNVLTETNEDYDVIMFAYNLQQHLPTEYANLHKVIEASTASCYLVNHTFYDKLIELYEWALPQLDETMHHWIYANDQVWKRLQPTAKWYCVNPRQGRQRPGHSDNSDRFMDLEC